MLTRCNHPVKEIGWPVPVRLVHPIALGLGLGSCVGPVLSDSNWSGL